MLQMKKKNERPLVYISKCVTFGRGIKYRRMVILAA
jgi:hypothetical protein